MTNPIKMSAPDISAEEVAAVNSVLYSDALSFGPKIEKFEAAFSTYVGTQYATAVSSGTAGLHLCMILADVQEGDYVITTPFSFIASANCILYQRGIPIFVDIDADTGNINSAQAAETIHALSGNNPVKKHLLPPALRNSPSRRASDLGRLKAVLVVHLFGQPCDIAPIQAETRRHRVKLIEDACEAIGAGYCNQNVGTFGDAAVFAFYPNKQMTTGEGGMIVYNGKKWDRLCRSLRNQGRDVFDSWLNHSRLGFNYRMDEMSAAFGLVQLQRIEKLLNKRSQVALWYNERIKLISGVNPITVSPTTSRKSWFIYAVRFAEGIDRTRIMSQLQNAKIPSRPYFTPIHLQHFYRKRFGYREGDFPQAESAGMSVLALPFHGNMSIDQVDKVCEVLNTAIQNVPIRKHNRVFVHGNKRRLPV